MVDYSILRLRLIVFKSFVSLPVPYSCFFFSRMVPGKVDEKTSRQQNAHSSRGHCRSAFLYAVRVCMCVFVKQKKIVLPVSLSVTTLSEENNVPGNSTLLQMLDNQARKEESERESKSLWNVKLMSLVILGNACQALTSFSPLFTQHRGDRERAGEAETERQDREEQKEWKGHYWIWMRNPELNYFHY